MIKATIQNSPYCTEIRFPCSETELSKKLGELRMFTEHLAPMATIIEIEPEELSMLTDCDVSLDALNYLGKRMDGMSKGERNQFLAVLSCEETGIGCSLKNIINLTFNLERFTLIEDTDDVEQVGRTHILNVRGYLSESESNNHEWLAEQGMKLLDSGRGIDTDYGKIYINKDVPFKEKFNGTTFPAYYFEANSVAEIVIEYDNLTEFVELPCEDISIQKAMYRLCADNLNNCKITVDSTRDISDEWSDRISEVEKTKDLFRLNKLLKTADLSVKWNQPESILQKEIARRLSKEGYNFSFENDEFSVKLSCGDVIKIRKDDVLHSSGNFSDEGREAFYALYRLSRSVLDYCAAYEKAVPLVADGLSDKYRCLAEFNETVLAAKYIEEHGFEFVTWSRTYDGKSLWHGHYYSDYAKAKEDFATRSGLVDQNKLFSAEELKQIGKCVDFTMQNCGDLRFEESEALQKLNGKISENLPEQQQSEAPEMSM